MQVRWIHVPMGWATLGAQADDPDGRGHDPDATSRESPVHRVPLEGFVISGSPIAVSTFAAFVDAGGYDDRAWWSAGGHGDTDAPDRWAFQLERPHLPVVGVSWYEAMAFCSWAGVALPTEAQWEYAARGPEARRYPWGDAPPDDGRINSLEAGLGGPSGPRLFPRGRTPGGIEDMSGNVWEWCRDVYVPYAEQDPRPLDGLRRDEPADAPRVFRGGCFAARARWTRLAMRSYGNPDQRFERRGFRVVGGD